jgi:RNA polymerase sigma factor (sigma-70 family)
MNAGGGDAMLVAALRARDPAVARPLWQCFAPSIIRIARRTMGLGAEVEDVAEVVLLRVFDRGRRLRPGADLGQVVLRATARVLLAELRRRKIRRLLSTCAASAPRARAPRQSSEPKETAAASLYRILDRLRAADRIAFVLHHLENLDVRQVAVAMGGTAAGTERRLRRSLRMVLDGLHAAYVRDDRFRPGLDRDATSVSGNQRPSR